MSSPYMFMRAFINIARGYLIRHPWQTILMVLGITLGVAVVVAIDLANSSASRAFDLSTASVAGRATHQIVAGPSGLDEKIYAQLRRSGIASPSAPVITAYAFAQQLDNQTIQLLGIDPFAEQPFRDYHGRRSQSAGIDQTTGETADLTAFLTQPGALFISSELAAHFGLAACSGPLEKAPVSCRLTLEISGQKRETFIAGLIQPADQLSKRALDSLVLADISTAQELTGRHGKIDRIDLILQNECSQPQLRGECAEEIMALLPANISIEPVQARAGTIEQMTAAFRLNLTALSLLALVVGLFLIYNTMTFSVVQRRPLFGTLRCLGATRREVFGLVMIEALLVGVLGSLLGVFLGVVAGQGAVQMVTRTINDLFFVLNVRGVQIPVESLIKGAALGIVVTLVSAAPPALEAASIPPRIALSRSGLESKARKAAWLAARLGVVMFGIGSLLLAIPTRNLVVSFLGTFTVIIGLAMLAPATTVWLMQRISPLTGGIWGTLGRMAPRDVTNSLSRTAVAVSALMVAVSVTIGVSLMVSSFRHTVIDWLSQTLQGDIYISAPSLTSTQSNAALDPAIFPILENRPEIDNILILRAITVESPAGPVQVAASNNPSLSQERTFLPSAQTQEEIHDQMAQGAVIISEPLAYRLGIPVHGGVITLNTDNGPYQFPVAGIYYDYSSTTGIAMMSLDIYRQHWDDQAITAAALILDPDQNIDMLADEIRTQLSPIQRLLVRPNQVLRQEVLQVFDRTFAITGALQLLATVVAFIGVLSALLSLELDRQHELGILRAIGLTSRQLFGLISLETGLLGAVAGLLSLPTGYILAWILIFIINRRSFGWTLQMSTSPDPFVEAILVAVAAALLAGLYPAIRMSRITEADAIRYE